MNVLISKQEILSSLMFTIEYQSMPIKFCIDCFKSRLEDFFLLPSGALAFLLAYRGCKLAFHAIHSAPSITLFFSDADSTSLKNVKDVCLFVFCVLILTSVVWLPFI